MRDVCWEPGTMTATGAVRGASVTPRAVLGDSVMRSRDSAGVWMGTRVSTVTSADQVTTTSPTVKLATVTLLALTLLHARLECVNVMTQELVHVRRLLWVRSAPLVSEDTLVCLV